MTTLHAANHYVAVTVACVVCHSTVDSKEGDGFTSFTNVLT